jgi:predicted nucleotide-binding protein (sugar kinase/HSP70/actin superfamily)
MELKAVEDRHGNLRQMTVGIPRAFMYERYGVLWKNFFARLGIRCIVSPPTDKSIVDAGTDLASDEVCLSTKIYLGHVAWLIGKCDCIFVPRMSNFGVRRYMCTKFESLPDLVANTFRETGIKIISYDLDEIKGVNEKKAVLDLGKDLGYRPKEVLKAYQKAKKAYQEDWKKKVQAEEKKYKTDKIKILVAAHSYIEDDEYVGRPIFDMIEKMGAVPIKADIVDRKSALKVSRKVSPTIKWELSREIMGSVQMHRNKVDGVILVSAYPCGPDSMVDEMIVRKMKDLTVLTLVVDAQEGTAGLETRLESFVDVLRMQRGEL